MQLSEPPDHTPDPRSDTGIRVTGLQASPLAGRAAQRPGRPEKAPFRQADVGKKYVNRDFLGKYLSYSAPTSPVDYSSKTEQIPQRPGFARQFIFTNRTFPDSSYPLG